MPLVPPPPHQKLFEDIESEHVQKDVNVKDIGYEHFAIFSVSCLPCFSLLNSLWLQSKVV